MQKIKMIAFGCGTLAMALGAGQFMQSRGNTDHAAMNRHATPAPHATAKADGRAAAKDGAVALSSIELTSAVPTPPAAALAPAVLPETPAQTPVQEAALGDAVSDALPTEEPAPSLTCDYSMSAVTAPGAMVSLSLDAPCASNDRFTLHHNGMMFTEVTDAGGHAEMLVPALASNAVFIASFPSGAGAVATTDVPDLGNYQRVAVQWQGDSGIQLHALEFGAAYGSDGDVWAQDSRDVAAAATGDQGFLTQLGNAEQSEALMAEVYTFPSHLDGPDGTIDISVDAEVTQANCTRDIEAQAMQTQAGGAIMVKDVTLAMPECDAIGDFLVLKNLLNDLTIARN